MPTQLLRNLAFAQRSAAWLRKHRDSFDILHLNGFVTWADGSVNTSHMVHSSWLQSPVHTCRVRRGPYGAYHWLFTFLNARWECRAYARSQVVVAVSESVRRQLLDVGVPADRLRVILNGVDPDEFSPGQTDRSGLGLPPSVPLALFVGDIRTPLKNLDTVLRALSHLPDVHLAVVGSLRGSPYPRVADRLALSDRVHFLGYRRDVAQVMRAVDLFVFPSRWEAFSLVILEAMASGLPIITASTVGATELVTPECGVVLPDPDDDGALAKAVRDLLQAPSRLRKMGQACRQVAVQYTWTRMSDSYLRLYAELSPQ
jgi:glycosyltransferase involved in cell wall biosynthesis